MEIILASSSIFRQKLLKKLNLTFEICLPDIDESRKIGEKPIDLVYRLAQQKASKCAKNNKVIIASDQVAVLKNKILTKPLNHKNAIKQLQQCAGNQVDFLTALCVASNNNYDIIVDKFSVYFRQLTFKQIENYLLQDKPYHCAGSFKVEGLGITLFTKLSGNDYNSLIGLPMIRLVDLLKKHNIDIL